MACSSAPVMLAAVLSGLEIFEKTSTSANRLVEV
jgi:hypothetical protein